MMNKTNIYVSVRTEEECKSVANALLNKGEYLFRITKQKMLSGIFDSKYNCIHFHNDEWIRESEGYLIKEGKTLITLDQLESMLCGKGEENSIPKINYPVLGYAPGNYYCTCVNCKTTFQGDKRAVQCEVCALRIETSSLRKELEEKKYTLQDLEEAHFRGASYGYGKKSSTIEQRRDDFKQFLQTLNPTT